MTAAKTKKLLWIFRHGETDWNREARFQGGTDIALNATGVQQAEELRLFFKANPVEAFYSSDLGRVRETVRICNRILNVQEFFDPRLRETNLGDAEGLRAEEVDAKFGPGALQAWRESGPQGMSFCFPNGESKAQHLARALEALNHLLVSREESVLGVGSHGGTIRRLIHHFNPDLKETAMVANCGVYRLDFNGAWTMDPVPQNNPIP